MVFQLPPTLYFGSVLRPEPIRLVLLDFDNLLIDTDTILNTAYEKTFRLMSERGVTKQVDLHHCDRKKDEKSEAFFFRVYGDIAHAKQASLQAKAFAALEPTMAIRGARETLEYLQHQHLPFAIVSNSPQEILNTRFTTLFGKEFGDTPLFGDAGKPSIAAIKKACAHFRLRPNKSVLFVGDNTHTDVKAAADAGCSPVLFGAPDHDGLAQIPMTSVAHRIPVNHVADHNELRALIGQTLQRSALQKPASSSHDIQYLHQFSQELQGGRTIAELMKTVDQRQHNLINYLQNAISASGSDAQLIANGSKRLLRAKEKTRTGLHGNPAQLHDLSRATLRLQTPQDGERILAELRREHPEMGMIVPDWHISIRGNIRRKLYLAVPDDSGRPYVSELKMEMVTSPTLDAEEVKLRNSRVAMYHIIRKTEHPGGTLMDISDPNYVNHIWPEFCAEMAKQRASLPEHYIHPRLKTDFDSILPPAEMVALLVEQSRHIFHEMMASQSQEWPTLYNRVLNNQTEKTASTWITR